MNVTPGVIVHYVLAYGPHAGQCRGAMITRVWSAVNVNVNVFADHSNDGNYGGMKWVDSILKCDDAEIPPYCLGSWHELEFCRNPVK